MVHVRFEWNRWSTGPVTATIISGSWALACVTGSLVLGLLDLPGAASYAASASKVFLVVSIALVTFALATGLAVDRLGAGATADTPSRRGVVSR